MWNGGNSMKNMLNLKQSSVLWKYLKLLGKRLPIYIVAIIGMTVLSSLFDVIGSLLMKTVFEIAQSGQNKEIYSSILFNVSVGAVCTVMSVICMYTYNREAKTGALIIKQKVFEKSLKLPMSYYDTHHSAELLSRLIYDTDTLVKLILYP